jgi:hypothetical protein
MREDGMKSTWSLVIALVGVVATSGIAAAQERLPDLRVTWGRELPVPFSFRVEVRKGEVRASWRVTGSLLHATADTKADEERTVRLRFSPALEDRLARSLAAIDFAAAPVDGGVETTFGLEVGERRLEGACGQFPRVSTFVAALGDALFASAEPPAFACLTVATFDGVPAHGAPPKVEVRVHGPTSRWANQVVRLVNDREVARWTISKADMDAVRALHRRSLMPIARRPGTPAPGGEVFMMLMSATPEGMAANKPRSTATGRTDDTSDALAALARKMLSLTPPAKPTAVTAPAAGLGGSLSGALRGVGR